MRSGESSRTPRRESAFVRCMSMRDGLFAFIVSRAVSTFLDTRGRPHTSQSPISTKRSECLGCYKNSCSIFFRLFSYTMRSARVAAARGPSAAKRDVRASTTADRFVTSCRYVSAVPSPPRRHRSPRSFSCGTESRYYPVLDRRESNASRDVRRRDDPLAGDRAPAGAPQDCLRVAAQDHRRHLRGRRLRRARGGRQARRARRRGVGHVAEARANALARAYGGWPADDREREGGRFMARTVRKLDHDPAFCARPGHGRGGVLRRHRRSSDGRRRRGGGFRSRQEGGGRRRGRRGVHG